MCLGGSHVPYTPRRFIEFGQTILKRTDLIYNETHERRWKAFFGASPRVCSDLWDRCRPIEILPHGVKPVHLLWALLMLKLYQTESVNAQMVGGVDEKTFRKWSGLFIDLISHLEGRVILWSNRFRGDIGNTCLVTVDGTDMRTNEPGGFAKEFLTHKLNYAGLKYELGINIRTGDIVWINGPFRGAEHDVTIARSAVIGALDEAEMLEADRGYVGEERRIMTPDLSMELRTKEDTKMAGIARARHETVNERLKNFMILSSTFRHDLRKHSSAFRAVCVVTQLIFENGEPPFEVAYSIE